MGLGSHVFEDQLLSDRIERAGCFIVSTVHIDIAKDVP